METEPSPLVLALAFVSIAVLFLVKFETLFIVSPSMKYMFFHIFYSPSLFTAASVLDFDKNEEKISEHQDS